MFGLVLRRMRFSKRSSPAPNRSVTTKTHVNAVMGVKPAWIFAWGELLTRVAAYSLLRQVCLWMTRYVRLAFRCPPHRQHSFARLGKQLHARHKQIVDEIRV